MTNYLVTGGAGFLGSHLIERLLLEDCGVVVIIDDMSEGNLRNLPQSPRIKVYKASILDDGISEYFKDIDVVFHLAALTRPQWSIVHPAEACRTNVEGTVRVFEHCVKNNIKRVVFVSSSASYGEQSTYPTKESAHMYPMSPYALNKWEGELHAEIFRKLHGLEVNSIRPFNVYGSRQNPLSNYSAAIPKFIHSILTGGQPYITGDGEQRRDFIYVDDVIEIIYLASKCKEFGEAFNAGSGENTSINELYNTICKVMGVDVKPTYVEKVFEPAMTLADMAKVKRVLNFTPQISLEEGLRRTVTAYEKTYRSGS